MLATLFKDERCQQLPAYGILEKMYAPFPSFPFFLRGLKVFRRTILSIGEYVAPGYLILRFIFCFIEEDLEDLYSLVR